MSVMVAEVPLLASFPKFSNYVSYMSHTDPCSPQKCGDFPRYTEKDVQVSNIIFNFDFGLLSFVCIVFWS